jgi:1-aminocyclopropane-1-carboxylate deaminase/D-cysteine desulfhydrase-like pyridoxal-dependent ACC family enzyme
MVVAAAATGTIMAGMAVAMALGVAVVGIVVTMTEEVIFPQETIHELCQCSSNQASISLGHFNDRPRHHLLPIL